MSITQKVKITFLKKKNEKTETIRKARISKTGESEEERWKRSEEPVVDDGSETEASTTTNAESFAHRVQENH